MENSKQITKEELRIPEFIFKSRPDNFKELLAHFYD